MATGVVLLPPLFLKYKIMKRHDIEKLFICSCCSPEHQLIMEADFDDDGIPTVYCSVHLMPELNIFKRIWAAIKYIFGHRSVYGEFDEFIFKSQDADKLQEVVDYLKRSHD